LDQGYDTSIIASDLEGTQVLESTTPIYTSSIITPSIKSSENTLRIESPITVEGRINSLDGISVNGVVGVTGSFVIGDKTVTVASGIITSIA